ncbi:hypothetical protein CPB86DRAFT_783508 [Serendipita vermifera]|nr:hypothetical protein CPB86DRAFT_783508 [Serendipita vermifera]
MENYKLNPEAVPSRLYRVQYANSQTKWSKCYGLQASSTFTPLRYAGLRNAVEYHLNWVCRKSSPFISTFGNRQHAKNWVNRWSRRNKKPCHLIEIQLNPNDQMTVFRVKKLVHDLDIGMRLPATQYYSEYLFFQNIPARSIVRATPIYGKA